MDRTKLIGILLALGLCASLYIGKGAAWAVDNELVVSPASVAPSGSGAAIPELSGFDPLKYTLGPDDVVEIIVMRHPEFSGVYPINLEGKLQYKFVGDIEVNGMTKVQLEEKLKKVLSAYLLSPEINVTVTEFRSKYILVLGEVSQPGKFFMRSEKISLRDAVVAAGLPTFTAAMRRCQLITPDQEGKQKLRYVDIYSVLYGGDLKHNIDMHPGEILYIPSTVMAKVIRVINPVASTIGLASSGTSDTSNTRRAVSTFAK